MTKPKIPRDHVWKEEKKIEFICNDKFGRAVFAPKTRYICKICGIQGSGYSHEDPQHY